MAERRRLPPQIRRVELTRRAGTKPVVRYRLTVDTGTVDGKRKQLRRRYGTEKEARAALAEIQGQVQPGGTMSTPRRRARHRAKGLPNWRIVRYADDFVVLVHGTGDDVETLREEVADVLAPLGLRLSEAKTRILHMSDGFDFLGFRIQWRRKRGTTKWYVDTFIADRPIRSLKEVRALTSRLSQQPPRDVLIRLNQIMRGWSAYFRHAVAKHTMGSLENFVWHRVIRWWKTLHRWRWKDVRRHHTAPTGQWARPSVDGIELFNLASVRITRYLYRGNKIPNPWTLANHA